jgi:hypothetical protein
MTSDADIRAWAKEADVAVPARGKVPDAVRVQFMDANPGSDNPGLSADEGVPAHGYADADAMPTRPQTAAQGHPDEVAPTRAPSRFGIGRRSKSPVSRGKTEHRRVSLESLASGAWTLLGQAASSRGLVPTGRALMLQAPVAGMILEDTLKGSVTDRILQPLARGGETAKELGALFGVPMLVTLITVKPQAAEMAVPMLKGMMREWAIIAGPRIKAREKREKRALEQLGVDETGLDEMVDGWIAALFMAGEIPEDEDDDA